MKAGRKVIRAVDDHVSSHYGLQKIIAVKLVIDNLDRATRIQLSDRFSSRCRFGFSNHALSMNNLTLQVGLVHTVEV